MVTVTSMTSEKQPNARRKSYRSRIVVITTAYNTMQSLLCSWTEVERAEDDVELLDSRDAGDLLLVLAVVQPRRDLPR